MGDLPAKLLNHELYGMILSAALNYSLNETADISLSAICFLNYWKLFKQKPKKRAVIRHVQKLLCITANGCKMHFIHFLPV